MSADVMFAVKLASAATLTVTGAPVALPKSITLYRGWTWLPCPYQSSVSLADSAPTFVASSGSSYSAGDQLKSQFEFAEYYAGYGFYGTLIALEPGRGYRVKTSEAGVATFN